MVELGLPAAGQTYLCMVHSVSAPLVPCIDYLASGRTVGSVLSLAAESPALPVLILHDVLATRVRDYNAN